MKKALLALICLFTMMAASTDLKAQEVTIPLMPGYTWIGNPSMDTLDITTVLGSFTPMEGDLIEFQYDHSEYINGEWFGTLQLFYPGYGYLYYSNRNVPVFLTLNVQQPAPQLIVTTVEPSEITATSAMSGGAITSNDGSYVFVLEKGICWATHPNPTVMNDSHTENGSGINSFTAEMTDLNLNTVYYVRAYAVTESGTTYGEEKTFTTRDGIPTVTTAEVTNILGDCATCGGTVTDNGGLNVNAHGVCWSSTHNPTVNDGHTIDGSGLGDFTSNITELNLNTIYYVRAYASTVLGTGYGEEVSFTTQSSSVGQYVDLGLPSGTLWATCNVGAEYPEAYGDYFAWGETTPKDTSGSNYTYSDNPAILPSDHDAATANWGSDWRMPTKEECEELYNNTTVTWTTQNGVNGRLFTASNGNSLFLPAAGYRGSSGLFLAGNRGHYWSSSLYTGNPSHAWMLYFTSGSYSMRSNYNRTYGHPVRAVRSSQN